MLGLVHGPSNLSFPGVHRAIVPRRRKSAAELLCARFIRQMRSAPQGLPAGATPCLVYTGPRRPSAPIERILVELQHYLTILKDRWIAALVAAVVVLAAVIGFTFLQTPEYQATNRVFVQTQAGSSVADLSSGVNFASQQITSYADVAKTPLVLDPVIEELDLGISSQELATQITTTVPPETLILEITVTDEDPAQAAAIANATSESLRERVAEQISPQITIRPPRI